jgi:hypothetical protein
MTVLAKTVTDAALRLAGHVGAAGAVDENRESRYIGLAPAYLTLLQGELALRENAAPPPPVEGPDDALAVSDADALRVLPAGLAMYFALVDRDTELYNHFAKIYYGGLLPATRAPETQLADYYGVLQDPTLR